jgi:hypothetical protein
MFFNIESHGERSGILTENSRQKTSMQDYLNKNGNPYVRDILLFSTYRSFKKPWGWKTIKKNQMRLLGLRLCRQLGILVCRLNPAALNRTGLSRDCGPFLRNRHLLYH